MENFDSILVDNIKKKLEEKEFKKTTGPYSDIDLSKTRLIKVYAVETTFRNVNFRHSEITESHFRNCRFVSCNFTGCIVKDSNFQGSKFENCDLSYISFRHTQLEDSILDTGLPGHENVQRYFARMLRINFNQTGNPDGANKAILVELAATKIHLKKKAFSKESFYREKYKGLERLQGFLEYIRFQILDFLWGNGESLTKLLQSLILIYILMSCYATSAGQSKVEALQQTARLLLISPNAETPLSLAITASIIKTVYFALFISILIRRLVRR